MTEMLLIFVVLLLQLKNPPLLLLQNRIQLLLWLEMLVTLL
jgi:hypothetical protein